MECQCLGSGEMGSIPPIPQKADDGGQIGKGSERLTIRLGDVPLRSNRWRPMVGIAAIADRVLLPAVVRRDMAGPIHEFRARRVPLVPPATRVTEQVVAGFWLGGRRLEAYGDVCRGAVNGADEGDDCIITGSPHQLDPQMRVVLGKRFGECSV